MHKYPDLKIWQKAIDLTMEVYVLIKKLPKEELFGLSGQLRRAAVSIPSNIAEGASRNSQKEFLHFLSIATGSAAELHTQFIIASRLEYITAEEFLSLQKRVEEIEKMIFALRKKLEPAQSTLKYPS